MADRDWCLPSQDWCCADVIDVREVHVCPWPYSIICTSPVHYNLYTSLEWVDSKGFSRILIGVSSFGPSILNPHLPVDVHVLLNLLLWCTVPMKSFWDTFIPHEVLVCSHNMDCLLGFLWIEVYHPRH